MPRLFISYASRDRTVARAIHRRLQQRGFDVWRDERQIERNWSREIAQALADADAVVVIWSSAAAGSRWVRNEWLTALALESGLKSAYFPKAQLCLSRCTTCKPSTCAGAARDMWTERASHCIEGFVAIHRVLIRTNSTSCLDLHRSRFDRIHCSPAAARRSWNCTSPSSAT